MEERYPVMQGETEIGRVELQREGLYVRLVCRCQLSGGKLRRLFVHTENGSLDLGTLIPMDGGFGLDMRIPAKRLSGELRFLLDGTEKKQKTSFVPIRPEEPFSYLERLKTSFLTIQNGEKGIIV